MATAVPASYMKAVEIEKCQEEEIVLKENASRWVMFPIHYDSLWAMYKEIENHFWAAEDFRFSKDKEQLKTLDKQLYDCLVKLISYHLLIDSKGDITRPTNLTIALLGHVQLPEARAFYGFQLSYENVHSETIGLMTLEIGDKFQDEYGKDKIEWVSKQLIGTGCFFKKLLVQAITKLVFRCCLGIFKDYLLKEEILATYAQALQTIQNDILIHLKFAFHIFGMLKFKMTLEEVKSLLEEAKELEMNYCESILPLESIGLLKSEYIHFTTRKHSGDLSSYINSSLNQVLLVAGYNEEYPDAKELPSWLKSIQVDRSAVATKATQAKKAPQISSGGDKNIEIKFDEDF
ncbi:bifunctional Ferritin-like superfamily/Ribonucleotide reductase small subunit family/Ribonucleotide reductase small subunit/Ribonucleotide reductase-like [Babesia duncani]|uniref:Bifunctional Ferritin-like superfamily/Ribonucleotide reductase small subunit family/Ribonucleotide reductase small subunit/Ribonucleotide reductase-like n=1 Tax=Babesia duncani TaxID=323732 RepID=A0AAD9PNR2_9APIC|nr:bifunctional Ferritin-like superfamily/Ribonucleotide reductase small subunit family/Ribonucleotide reductase small subunit/Ribonucleotide reductase-like [Babesia duncani]